MDAVTLLPSFESDVRVEWEFEAGTREEDDGFTCEAEQEPSEQIKKRSPL